MVRTLSEDAYNLKLDSERKQYGSMATNEEEEMADKNNNKGNKLGLSKRQEC